MGDDKGMLKALALATQLGFAVAGPLVVFIGGGAWLDSTLGTKPWLFFVGLVLGILSAGAAFYQIATAVPAGKSSTAAKKAPGKMEPNGDTTDDKDD